MFFVHDNPEYKFLLWQLKKMKKTQTKSKQRKTLVERTVFFKNKETFIYLVIFRIATDSQSLELINSQESQPVLT